MRSLAGVLKTRRASSAGEPITWTLQSTGLEDFQLFDVRAGSDGNWVAVGLYHTAPKDFPALVINDTINPTDAWTSKTLSYSGSREIYTVDFDGVNWCISMTKTYHNSWSIYTTTNPYNAWIENRTSLLHDTPSKLRYLNGIFLGAFHSYSTYVTTNPDGWWRNEQKPFVTQPAKDFAYGDGYWVTIGHGSLNISYTMDPYGSWSVPYETFDFTVNSIAYGNGYWVIVGYNGKIATCYGNPTGTWSVTTIPGDDQLMSVYFANNAWVITSGWNGRIFTCGLSPNGPWTERFSGTPTTYFNSVYYYNGYWVAVGYSRIDSVLTGIIATAVPGV